MSTKATLSDVSTDTVLLVDSDILVRMPIAAYLRDCGYHVIEVGSLDAAIAILSKSHVAVDIVLSAVQIAGSVDGFGLAQWVRANHPGVQIILTGNADKAAHAAGDLCHGGPHLAQPYTPEQVVEWIKRLRRSAGQMLHPTAV